MRSFHVCYSQHGPVLQKMVIVEAFQLAASVTMTITSG